jgi:hypothetical protein
VLSDDGRYRYALRRQTGVLGAEGAVLFVMLNPSTADATDDDPTIRRCLNYARRWGYARLDVANLYALRATNPAELFAGEDPVGPDNDAWLERLAKPSPSVVVAWGATPHPEPERARRVLELLEFYAGTARCLGQTRDLHPRHPLYVRADAARTPFRRLARSIA